MKAGRTEPQCHGQGRPPSCLLCLPWCLMPRPFVLARLRVTPHSAPVFWRPPSARANWLRREPLKAMEHRLLEDHTHPNMIGQKT